MEHEELNEAFSRVNITPLSERNRGIYEKEVNAKRIV